MKKAGLLRTASGLPANGADHFLKSGKFSLFVTGGYSLTFRRGTSNLGTTAAALTSAERVHDSGGTQELQTPPFAGDQTIPDGSYQPANDKSNAGCNQNQGGCGAKAKFTNLVRRRDHMQTEDKVNDRLSGTGRNQQ
jgi:hypothetical protein